MAEFRVSLFVVGVDINTAEGPSIQVLPGGNPTGSFYAIITDDDLFLSDTSNAGSGERDTSQQTAMIFDSATDQLVGTIGQGGFIAADELSTFNVTSGGSGSTQLHEITYEQPGGADLKFMMSFDPLVPGATYTRSGPTRDTQVSETDQDVPYALLLCFAAGTLIDTVNGPQRAETLEPGTDVRTQQNGLQKLCWCGSRQITDLRAPENAHLRPVIIRRGALGDGLPERDLRVSPQHRVLLSDWQNDLLFGTRDVLVAAAHLTNETSICVDEELEEVEYIHLLFDRHEVIFSEGLATESFHPGLHAMDAMERSVRDEIIEIFPDLMTTGFGELAFPALKRFEGRALARLRGR